MQSRLMGVAGLFFVLVFGGASSEAANDMFLELAVGQQGAPPDRIS